jgi:hypothetical protein
MQRDETQNALHTLLNNFLNGSTLTSFSKLTYPLVQRNTIDTRTAKTLTAALQTPVPRTLSNARMIRILQALHKRVHNYKGTQPPVQVRLAAHTQWFHERPEPIRSCIATIAAEVAKHTHVVHCSISGSIATDDYRLGWSDVDGVIILTSTILRDAKALLALRASLMRVRTAMHSVDPLQHHGLTVLLDTDLAAYPQAYYPKVLFEKSKLLHGTQTLPFRFRDDTAEREHAFQQLSAYFARTPMPRNRFDQKGLYHMVALIPIFYYQARGTHLYKPDAFKRMYKDVPREYHAALLAVTRIRDTWRAPKPTPRMLPTPFLDAIRYSLTPAHADTELCMQAQKLMQHLTQEQVR